MFPKKKKRIVFFSKKKKNQVALFFCVVACGKIIFGSFAFTQSLRIIVQMECVNFQIITRNEKKTNNLYILIPTKNQPAPSYTTQYKLLLNTLTFNLN